MVYFVESYMYAYNHKTDQSTTLQQWKPKPNYVRPHKFIKTPKTHFIYIYYLINILSDIHACFWFMW